VSRGIHSAMGRLLTHLHLECEAPTLDDLHRLVREHQRLVPLETRIKLMDDEPGLHRGDFVRPLENDVERIVSRGAGGLRWTLTRGFRALLEDLGFEAAFMVLDPGHCCVRAEIPEGPEDAPRTGRRAGRAARHHRHRPRAPSRGRRDRPRFGFAA